MFTDFRVQAGTGEHPHFYSTGSRRRSPELQVECSACEALPPLVHISSWHAEGVIYLSFLC